MPYEITEESDCFMIYIPGVDNGPRVRFLHLQDPSPPHIEITFVYCPESHRRQGLATACMNAFLEKADREKKLVRLDVCGDDNGDDGPNTKELTKWYESFGFVRIYNPEYRPTKHMMERWPKKPATCHSQPRRNWMAASIRNLLSSIWG